MISHMQVKPAFREVRQRIARHEPGLACQPLVQQMQDEQSLVHELLEMAACPESFTKSELSLMLLVAATAIIKLEQFDRQTESRQSHVRSRD